MIEQEISCSANESHVRVDAHDRGSTPVSGVGESVSLSPTSDPEDVRYSKRRLPHFEKRWTRYAVTMSTRSRRILSPAARTLILNALRHFHQRRYELFAACVMPDHAHFLMQPWPKERDDAGTAAFWEMSKLVHSVKSFTGHEVNKVEETTGALWEEEVFDRYIRSERDLHEKFRYICNNPWEARIVGRDESYVWIWTPDHDLPAQLNVRQGETPSPTPETGVLSRETVAHALSGIARVSNYTIAI